MITMLSERRLLWPGVMTLVGLAILIGLGTWQLERRAWKEGLIAAIEARTKAEPVSLTEALARLGAQGDVEYTRVKARGKFLHDREQYFYAPDAALGPGYHVYTPFEPAGETSIVFVNRGFVPEALKDPAKRMPGQIEGEIELMGLLRMPGTKGTFTPDNEPQHNLWYWRDLDGLIRAAFGAGDRSRVPVFVDAEAAAPGGWPKGGATRLELPNRHLEYAITWFGLAAALIAVFAAYAVPRLGRANP
jgi:surfeit locus 1 family protein